MRGYAGHHHLVSFLEKKQRYSFFIMQLVFTLWLGAEGRGAHSTLPLLCFSSQICGDA